MNFKNDIDKIMDSVDIRVDNDMKKKILNQTTQKESRQRVWGTGRRAVVAAMVTVLCVGTVAVGAKELPKLWNSTVAKFFNANEKTQEKLVQKGYADVKETKEESTDVLTTEKNGIRVSVKQTLADKYGIHIYLDVKSTNGLKLTGNRLFDVNDFYVDGKDIYNNQGGGFVQEKYKVSDYEHIYELYGVNDTATDITGKKIQVHLADLIGGDHKLDEDVLVSGDWKLNWTVKGNTTTKTIKLDGSYEIKGVVKGEKHSAVCNLKSLEISPLSFHLTYDCKDWKKVSGELGNTTIPIKIVMKNGEVYARATKDKVDENHVLSGAGFQGDKDELTFFDDFAFDIDNIDYMEVAGVRYEVK